MAKRIVFEIDDVAWLRKMWPECADGFKEPSFKCTYALSGDQNGCQHYELLTVDGRTNYNDLNGYERMCLRDCMSYFENRLHIVGYPDYCIGMKVIY